GSGWHIMGTFNGPIRDLCVRDSSLFAAGGFRSGIDGGYEFIAEWTGSAWRGVGAPLGEIYDLEFYNNTLHAALAGPGGAGVFRMRVLDGTWWDEIGGSLGTYVYALAVHKGFLVAGGNFQAIGDLYASNVARWDGARWTGMKGGINGAVSCFTIYNEDLVVGGSFSEAGSIAAANIARYDGVSWSAFGSGTHPGGDVWALAPWGDALYVGGRFVTAGGKVSPRIARWID
ncbi:MAG: hypothetical protein V1774_03210, partial [Candidatus Eisenbacteria bacterium]